jgi:hypothetical protein
MTDEMRRISCSGGWVGYLIFGSLFPPFSLVKDMLDLMEMTFLKEFNPTQFFFVPY